MIRQERRRIERGLKKVNIMPSSERLTASTGIGMMVELLYKSPLMQDMSQFLPSRISHRSLGSPVLALTLVAAHLMGVESVEDLEELRDDEFLIGLFGGSLYGERANFFSRSSSKERGRAFAKSRTRKKVRKGLYFTPKV